MKERLLRAEEVLGLLPPGDHADSEASEEQEQAPWFLRVFAVAHAAIASVESFVEGSVHPSEGAPPIAWKRGPSYLILAVDASLQGEALEREVQAFVAILRERDQMLKRLAELVGLLAGLCLQWAAAGFAPPVVVGSLRERAPRILALGRGMG